MPSNALSSVIAVRTHLNATFSERENVVDGLLQAILAGEHVVLLGPPGTAKSAIAEEVAQSLGLKVYRTLLTKFTTPPEIFGPLSLAGLEQDEVRYQTRDMLPEADLAIIDEIFKAGSALLNSLLAIINERTFYNGTLGPTQVPLRTIVGTSNELPQGEGLEALWDRFLVRHEVPYVKSPAAFRAMARSNLDTTTPPTLDKAALDAAQNEVRNVSVSDAVLDALYEVRNALAVEGIVASDRRWKKSLKVAQAFAWMNGNVHVDPEDLMVLRACLWQDPKQMAKLNKVMAKVLNSDAHTMAEILDAAEEVVKAFQASPKGVKESASFGKQLKAMKEKAESMVKKAPARRAADLKISSDKIAEHWRNVIQLAAQAAGLNI
jgi:MoxR-like ATPase